MGENCIPDLWRVPPSPAEADGGELLLPVKRATCRLPPILFCSLLSVSVLLSAHNTIAAPQPDMRVLSDSLVAAGQQVLLLPNLPVCCKTGTVSVGNFHSVRLALPAAEFSPRTLACLLPYYYYNYTTHVDSHHISRLISIYTPSIFNTVIDHERHLRDQFAALQRGIDEQFRLLRADLNTRFEQVNIRFEQVNTRFTNLELSTKAE